MKKIISLFFLFTLASPLFSQMKVGVLLSADRELARYSHQLIMRSLNAEMRADKIEIATLRPSQIGDQLVPRYDKIVLFVDDGNFEEANIAAFARKHHANPDILIWELGVSLSIGTDTDTDVVSSATREAVATRVLNNRIIPFIKEGL